MVDETGSALLDVSDGVGPSSFLLQLVHNNSAPNIRATLNVVTGRRCEATIEWVMDSEPLWTGVKETESGPVVIVETSRGLVEEKIAGKECEPGESPYR
jgi:hypothetical protein